MSDSPPPALKYFVEFSGQRYGPADLDLLRQWVQEGRIGPDAILIEEASQRHLAAGEVPGLFEPGMSPPPPVGSMAPPPEYTGKKPFPVWGILLIVFGGLCVLCLPITAAILFPVFSQAKLAAKRTVALSHMKQLGLAGLMYTNDYDDHFPPTMDSALDAKPYLYPYASKDEPDAIFVSVNPDGGSILGNGQLAGRSDVQVKEPANTVMFYDEKPWDRRGMACYVDGHAKLGPFDDMMSSLQTDPIDHSQDQPGSKP